MADDTLQLTYRELAERLAISPDAARMKAKRAVKSARWRIIPGNHPNDPVRVELPLADLAKPEAVAGERVTRSTGERKGRTHTRTDTDALAVVLQSAQERIAELTDQLTGEKDRHRETAIELAKASAKADALASEIWRLEMTIEQLQADRRTWWQRLTGR